MNLTEGHVSDRRGKIMERKKVAAGVVLVFSGLINHLGGYGRRFFEDILGPPWERYDDFAFKFELPHSCLGSGPIVSYTPGETFKIFIDTFSDSFKHCIISNERQFCIEAALRKSCFDPTYSSRPTRAWF